MTVRSADRTLGIFEAFEDLRRPVPLSRLAEHVGIPISSCHGLVETLMERGYLYSVGQSREIYPTRRLFDVGNTILTHDLFLERMRPMLTEVRDGFGETVIVGKRQGDAVLYLDVIEGLNTIRYTAQPGEYKPLHSSAIGKALLGCLKPKTLEASLANYEMERITPYTLTTTEALKTALDEGRQKGYFVTHGENVTDVSAVAISVELNNDYLGIAVAGPASRMTKRESEIGRTLVDLKSELEVSTSRKAT